MRFVRALPFLVFILFIFLMPGYGLYTAERKEWNTDLANVPFHLLLQRPVFKKLIELIEEALAERLAFRKELLEASVQLRYHGVISGGDRVLVGKNHWLFITTHRIFENYRGLIPLSEYELEHWTRVLENRTRWLKERHVPYLVSIAPDKHTVYPENLPDWMTRIGPRTRLEQLVERFFEHQTVEFLDLRQALLNAKNWQQLYFQHDAHWNFYGGYIVYDSIMNRLAQMGVNIVSLKVDDFLWTKQNTLVPDLMRVLGLETKESYQQPERRGGSSVIGSEILPDPELDNRQVRQFRSNGPTDLHLFVIHDSFVDIGMLPFLIETFREVTFFHHDFNHRFNAALIEDTQPDIVVQISVERTLSNLPSHDSGMFKKFR